MRWRLVVQHLMAPIPAVLVGATAGIGGTRWYALELVDPTPPIPPEAWADLGALLMQGGAVFLLPLLVVGGLWLWDILTLLRRPAVVTGRDA